MEMVNQSAEVVSQNKMGIKPISKLIWQMGLPMIISMVLQAIYNIVDTIFVINMGPEGVAGNLALTFAFPIQLLIIAIGVGTGVGINSLLSRTLGEKDKKKVAEIAGNGIFIGIIIYLVFLLFGLFGSRWFISIQAGGDEQVIEMGTTYLQICCCFSFGSIGYTIYERFLQSTGKTIYSTIAQISGAVANIILDYVFIYPLKMGVAGAAWATIIGQILSLVIAMIFHYAKNKEIGNGIKYLSPSKKIVGGIYKIGISAAIMQGLLSVMMFGMNLILGTASVNSTLLQNSFGIYYKIMQLALFAAFGISNTIISILSFNYGMKNKSRVKECLKWGIIVSIIVTFIISILFECIASPLASLFGMTSVDAGNEIKNVVIVAIRISSISYVFMGVSVAIQGVLQALRYAVSPLIISLLRLVVFVLPVAYLFTLSSNAVNILWWTFPIVEVLTMIVSLFILKHIWKKDIITMPDDEIVKNDNLIITISREHGSNGKQIGKLVAKKLNIPFYDKEILGEVAKQTGMAEEYLSKVSDNVKSFNSIYLSTTANQEVIIAQAEVIKEIAKRGSCVIVGRGADYILKDYENVLRIFIHADDDFKIKTIMKLYGDNREDAEKNMKRANNARSIYYNFISGQNWGDMNNYDICINSSNGAEYAAKQIENFIKVNIKHSKKYEINKKQANSLEKNKN